MAKTQLKQINGMMWVSDVARPLEYYTRKLGFNRGYTCESDGVVDFAIEEREPVAFFFRRQRGDCGGYENQCRASHDSRLPTFLSF